MDFNYKRNTAFSNVDFEPLPRDDVTVGLFVTQTYNSNYDDLEQEEGYVYLWGGQVVEEGTRNFQYDVYGKFTYTYSPWSGTIKFTSLAELYLTGIDDVPTYIPPEKYSEYREALSMLYYHPVFDFSWLE